MKTVTASMEQIAELLLLQLDSQGVANLAVTGSSMLPMLHSRRDMVCLKRLEGPPRKGDVLLYQRADESYILHRVVKKPGKEVCICCGDNQWVLEQVPLNRIVAVVVGFYRNGKKYSVKQKGYRCYAGLWTGLLPVRKPLLLARRLLGRLRRGLQNLSKEEE